jgi:hypothetical protein
MTIKSLQRLQLLVRELGTLTAVLYAVDQLLRRFSPRCKLVYYRFVAQPLRDQPRLAPHRGKGFEFQLLHRVEPTLAALDRPPEVIYRRFAQGAQCLLSTKQQTVVGCIWFMHQAYLEDEVRVEYVLPSNGHCVWDFDVFVEPNERLGWLFAKQWDAFDQLLQPLGVRYSVSRISAFNQRSLASHLSLGAHPCGRALFLCLGPIQWMVASVYPYLAWGGRPRLSIHPQNSG